MRGWEKLFGGLSMATPASTRSRSTSTSSRTLRALRSQRCDFADLVHPRRRSGYSVTAFPAQNGFGTRPVATDSCRCRLGPVRARRPLCLLGCASSVASLVSAEYLSTKQVLTVPECHGVARRDDESSEKSVVHSAPWPDGTRRQGTGRVDLIRIPPHDVGISSTTVVIDPDDATRIPYEKAASSPWRASWWRRGTHSSRMDLARNASGALSLSLRSATSSRRSRTTCRRW